MSEQDQADADLLVALYSDNDEAAQDAWGKYVQRVFATSEGDQP